MVQNEPKKKSKTSIFFILNYTSEITCTSQVLSISNERCLKRVEYVSRIWLESAVFDTNI